MAESFTWIEEEPALPIPSGCVFCDRNACIASGAIVIVHRDLDVCALEVGIGGIKPKALATSPRNLEGIQEDP
jgi:predicted transcriptional regulator